MHHFRNFNEKDEGFARQSAYKIVSFSQEIVIFSVKNARNGDFQCENARNRDFQCENARNRDFQCKNARNRDFSVTNAQRACLHHRLCVL